MCRWVQHHYGACRHQHTYLEDFCPNSTAVTSLPPHKKAPDDTTVPDLLWTPDSGEGGGGGAAGGRHFGGSGGPPRQASSYPPAGASISIPRPPPSSSNRSGRNHRVLHPSSTFSDYSFTPIPEETSEDIASLKEQQQHQKPVVSPRRFSEPAPNDMAGFAPFGKSTFRQLMEGGCSPQLATPVTTTKHHNDREELQRGSFRMREPGIRDHSDESYDLPDSNEILQHISQNCRSEFTSRYIGTDTHRETSFGSDGHFLARRDTVHSQQDSIDAIESDLNVLQTEITALRAEEMQPAQMEQFPVLPTPQSKIPISRPEHKQQEQLIFESKAAKFQARIAQQETEKQARLAKEKLERENLLPECPPGIEQFPGLGTPSSSTSLGRTISSSGDPGIRKASYASAATSGMKVAVDKAGSGNWKPVGSDAPSTVSASKTSRGSVGSFNSPQQSQQSIASPDPGSVSQVALSEAGDNSVIISPQSARIGTPSAGTWTASPSTRTVDKHSPRFAQPTMATARRVDETLRKNSTMSKASPEGSPTKSTCALTQSPPKRAPIPANWTVSTDSSPSKQSLCTAVGSIPSSSPSKQSFYTAVGSVHSSSPSRSRDPPSSPERKAISPMNSSANSPEQGLRKKTSSYMSPTKATTQRNIETLGQETVKQSPPRLSKAVPKIDTNVSPAKAVVSPMENTPPLSAPLSGSTLRSRSPPGVEQHNITKRVMQQLMTERPVAMVDASSTAPEEFAPRAASSSTARVFSSPIETTGRLGRRFTVGSPVVEMVAAKAREAGFPEVANTTVKRRGSHGHLLTPIVKRLGREGLLRPPENLPYVPEHAPQVDRVATMESFAQPNAPMLPMPVQQPTHTIAPAYLPPHMLREISITATVQGLSLNAANAGYTGPPAQHQNPQTGSLRATAKEFRPMGQLQPTQQTVGPLELQKLLSFKSDEEWYSMDQGVRDTIRTLRHEQATEGWQPSRARRPHDPAPAAYSSMDRPTAAVGLPDGNPVMIQNPANMHETSGAAVQSSAVNPPRANRPIFMTRRARSHVVEAGAVLKPELDQITNSIQWFKEAADGSKEVIHFGRATAPDNTPTISPSSNDTSPPKGFTPSPGSARRWRIGSLMHDKYGWKGGDGLEISFRGSGANAERDPNPPSDVNFGQHGPRASNFDNGARFIGGEKENDPGSPPLAPRSREQWAKLMGMNRVPCSKLEFNACEEVPTPPLYRDSKYGPFGFCEPCYPADWP